MKWRVVITDSEQPDGVAPDCPNINRPNRRISYIHYSDEVQDCCPKPHLKCISNESAIGLAWVLTHMDVEVCE